MTVKGPAKYDIVEVHGTLCIKIISPISPAELERVCQLPEVDQVRDGTFIELVPLPLTKKRRLGRKPNPYKYANEVAWKIATTVMNPRISAWVNRQLTEPRN